MAGPAGQRHDLVVVKARTSLHGLAVRYGLAKLQRRGRTWWACCPLHGERTPSFHLDEVKGYFHCFGCGAHGSAIDLVMQVERVGFGEAVRRLAGDDPAPVSEAELARLRRREQELARRDAAEREQRRRDAAALWAAAAPIRTGDLADRYLRGRGLVPPPRDSIGTLPLPDPGEGISDGWPASLRLGWAISKGGRRWPALVAGVTRWPGRRVVAVQLTPLAEPGVKAWKDPPRLTRGDYRTGAVRLGPWREGLPIVLVEGTEDGLAALLLWPGAVAWAILGTDNGPLVLLPDRAEAVLMLDGDRAGRWAMAKSSPELVERGHAVRTIGLPENRDPLEHWLAVRPERAAATQAAALAA